MLTNWDNWRSALSKLKVSTLTRSNISTAGGISTTRFYSDWSFWPSYSDLPYLWRTFDMTADVYALAFVLYMLRILQNFYVIQAIGPKIEIIYRMLKDLCFFLLLFLLFILAFGIAFQSLVHPPSSDSQLHLSQDFASNVFRHILYIPYFVIFQQFDDIKDQISNLCGQ